MISAPNIQSPQIQLLLKAGVIVLPNFLILSLVLSRFLPGESFLSAITKGVLTNTRTKNINHSVHFSSVQSLSHVRLCKPMDCSKPGLPAHWQLPEFTQTHVHWVSDAFQPSQPLLSPSPLAFNPSQHQGLFQGVRWPKDWSFSVGPSKDETTESDVRDSSPAACSGAPSPVPAACPHLPPPQGWVCTALVTSLFPS